MNNLELSNLLSTYVKKESIEIDSLITNATTNLQLADTSSICFYHITDSPDAERLFLERLNKTKCRNIILSKEISIQDANVWVIDHDDFLKTQELISNILYPNKNKLKISGITGTNGKTTVSFLAMQLATLLGQPAISIGTIGIRSLDEIHEDDILSTTPSYLELRKIIYKYQDRYEHVFMEVSSHALAQSRLYNVELDSCAWTSFSQDHLDYHKDYNDYFNAKLKIIDSAKEKVLIIPSSEIELENKLRSMKIELELVDPINSEGLDIGFKASYNQANLAVAKRLVENVSKVDVASELLKKLKLPSGRFESLKHHENIIIIDFAHTPDALTNICRTIKEDFKEFELAVVFGCGGDRDKIKRPLMGKAVSEFADRVFVTSDNPRSEDPEAIIDDIVPGITIDYKREVSRRDAIRLAMNNPLKKVVVLIAGKGHEEYQDVKGQKKYFSDKDEVLSYIRECESV